MHHSWKPHGRQELGNVRSHRVVVAGCRDPGRSDHQVDPAAKRLTLGGSDQGSREVLCQIDYQPAQSRHRSSTAALRWAADLWTGTEGARPHGQSPRDQVAYRESQRDRGMQPRALRNQAERVETSENRDQNVLSVNDRLAQQHQSVEKVRSQVGEVESEEACSNLEVVLSPGTDGLRIGGDEQGSADVERCEGEERHQKTEEVPFDLSVGPEEPPGEADPEDHVGDSGRVDPVPPARPQDGRETPEKTCDHERADQRHGDRHILEERHFT